MSTTTPPLAPPAKIHHHLDMAAGINRRLIKAEMARVNSFNAKLAVAVTNIIGSMWCAYLFCLLAFCSLPAVLSAFAIFSGIFPPWLTKASLIALIALIAWIAQTFFQLVLLSVIMVGQQVQGLAADARSVQTEENTAALLDGLNVATPGGITDAVVILLKAMGKTDEQVAAATAPAPPPEVTTT
jgi:hypothetical protein